MNKLKAIIEQAKKLGYTIIINTHKENKAELEALLFLLKFTNALPPTSNFDAALQCCVYPNIREYQFVMNPATKNTIKVDYLELLKPVTA